MLVLDRNGIEIKKGQRVRFRDTYYYINMCQGAGFVKRIDDYGGVYIHTDQEMKHYSQNGFLQRVGKDWYFCSEYDYEKKVRVAVRKVGDPHEHGQWEAWLEVEKGQA